MECRYLFVVGSLHSHNSDHFAHFCKCLPRYFNMEAVVNTDGGRGSSLGFSAELRTTSASSDLPVL